MDSVCFCRECGELLEERWLYCPRCGNERPRDRVSWEAVIDESLDRAELEQVRGKMGLLDDISGRLDELEGELDAFLAGKP